MDAIPRLDGNEEHLVLIPGNPPNLLHLPKRLPILAPLPICYRTMPEATPKLTAFNEAAHEEQWEH